MMFSSPFYPYSYRYPYSRYGYQNNRFSQSERSYNKPPVKPTPDIKKEKSQKKETREINESPMFQLFGVSLYFDDILIICLLFFLFQEGVDDEWLYIALILLLLS